MMVTVRTSTNEEMRRADEKLDPEQDTAYWAAFNHGYAIGRSSNRPVTKSNDGPPFSVGVVVGVYITLLILACVVAVISDSRKGRLN